MNVLQLGMSPSHTQVKPRTLRRNIVRLSAILVIIEALFLVYYSIPNLRPHHIVPPSVFELYGFSSTSQYVSSLITESQSNELCAPGFLFLVQDGHSPTIVDQSGELVWQERHNAMIENFRVQTFHGQNYLTYWAKESSGNGTYHMLDSSYRPRYNISAVGRVFDSLHDFTVTPHDTALISASYKRQADLSTIGGPVDGWVLDAMFQEIDITTGELLYEWQAADHVPITTTQKILLNGEGTKARPFDYFHINSINQGPSGDYLVSAGHIRALISIDKSTGEVRWNLGGRANSFKDFGGQPVVNFASPYSAHWIGYETLVVMDGAGGNETSARSLGMIIRVNAHTKQAAVQQIYNGPRESKGHSKGDMEISRDTGHVLINWGGDTVLNELTTDGELLCSNRFLASTHASAPSRISKHKWIANPLAKPVGKISGQRLFVHWNGATEVTEWQLQVRVRTLAEFDAPGYQDIARYKKNRFETSFKMPSLKGNNHYFRVAALDHRGKVLGYTDDVEWQQAWTGSELSQTQFRTLIGVCLFGGLLTIVSTLHIRWKNGEKERMSLPSYHVLDRNLGIKSKPHTP